VAALTGDVMAVGIDCCIEGLFGCCADGFDCVDAGSCWPGSFSGAAAMAVEKAMAIIAERSVR
jgi:hypothetical protein